MSCLKKMTSHLAGACIALTVGMASTAVQAAVVLEDNEYLIFYHHDALGSPAATTDEKGRLLSRETSHPYGKSAGKQGESGQSLAEIQGAENETRLGYTGHTFDGGSQLVYMKARFYDPAIGRFYSNDPVGFNTRNLSMFNRYAYANNNPYRYVDPDGNAAQAAAVIPFLGYTIYGVSVLDLGIGAALAYGLKKTKDLIDLNSSDSTSDDDSTANDGESTSKSDGKSNSLPENPDDLLDQGYEETSHPDAAANGHRTFVNPESGDEVRYDEGESGKPGYRGQDHYHRPNPDSTGRHDQYLDKDGNPVGRGSDESHLVP